MPAEAAAISVKPNSAAIKAMIRKITAHFSLTISLWLAVLYAANRYGQAGFPARAANALRRQ